MIRSGKTLTERLADYVCGLSYDDLPSEVVAKLKQVITHDLVVGLAGRHAEEVRRALSVLDTGLASAGRSTVIGCCRTAAPIDAAYANSVMIRTLRQEDSIFPSACHPGAMLIPAGFAVGEHQGNSGQELLTALAAGYEVMGKLANTQPWKGESERNPSHVFGAFGVAVVAAKLLKLDPGQMATAIAYAGNSIAMIADGFRNHQYGVVTRNGLTAAYLGQAGAPAARDALEGDEGFYSSVMGAEPLGLEEQLAALGVRWEVMTSVTKPFPCTAVNVIVVTLLQRILADHQLDRHEVVRISGRRPAELGDDGFLSKGPWEDAFRTTSSMPFALAAVLLDGQVTPERLQRYDDPEIVERAHHIDIELDDALHGLYHQIEVETASGERLSAAGDQSTLSDPDPVAVLRLHHADDADIEQAARIAETIARLDELDSLTEPAQAFG